MILTGKARVAGVMGWPVGHSLSPRLHGYWLRQHRIDGAYVPLPVRPADLAEALAALPKLGFAGANITVPHKEAAVAAVAAVSDEARRIGAVNTVTVDRGGRLLGSNSDAFGFLENLRHGCPGWTARAGLAVVLGAGGAARAVCAALIAAGTPALRLVNRGRRRAEALAAALGGPITVFPWEQRDRVLAGAALLVNSTTLGMSGQPQLELDLAALPTTAVVTDLVYRPLITRLLSAAQQRGNPVVDGLGMLLHQARPGFAAWFGVEPKVSEGLRRFMVKGCEEEW